MYKNLFFLFLLISSCSPKDGEIRTNKICTKEDCSIKVGNVYNTTSKSYQMTVKRVCECIKYSSYDERYDSLSNTWIKIE